MILNFLIFYHQFEDLSCKNKRCISIVLRMWHANNRWLNMLFKAKDQTELNSNVLTHKSPIHSIWVHGWFHMCLVYSYGVQFIQLKIGSPRGLLHYGQSYILKLQCLSVCLSGQCLEIFSSHCPSPVVCFVEGGGPE